MRFKRKDTQLLVEGWRRLLREGTGSNKLYFLIGPPGIGKSYWVKENLESPYLINLDAVTEAIASKYGLTYDDMFSSPSQEDLDRADVNPDYEHKKFGKVIDQQISWKKWVPRTWEKVNNAEIEVLDVHDKNILNAKNSGKDVVIDMTNMNQAGRSRIKDQLNLTEHETVGVVFHWEEDGVSYLDDLKKIAKKRSEEYKLSGKSKTIPDSAYDRMTSNYQGPLAEEFDEIINVPISKNAIGYFQNQS